MTTQIAPILLFSKRDIELGVCRGALGRMRVLESHRGHEWKNVRFGEEVPSLYHLHTLIASFYNTPIRVDRVDDLRLRTFMRTT